MDIQYFPGHMTKAKRNIGADLKLVDICIELRDARAPFATRNPLINSLIKGKQRLILLNKADLADDYCTEYWIKKISDPESHTFCIALDSRNNKGMGTVKSKITELAKEKQEKDAKKGIIGKRPVKAMIVGIPNVGKSTLINSLVGKISAKTGNKPGVTRGNQWININDSLLLLDTPGVLWPKFGDKKGAEALAMIGSLNDTVVNQEELAMKLLAFLFDNYKELLFSRYDITDEALKIAIDNTPDAVLGLDRNSLALLDIIAEKRGCIKKKAEFDYDKASKLLIDDFRSGKIGKITLEK